MQRNCYHYEVVIFSFYFMTKAEVIELLNDIKKVKERLDYLEISIGIDVNKITSCRLLANLSKENSIKYIEIKKKYKNTKLYFT